MSTYKKRMENKKVYVLTYKCKTLGVFGSLKALCDHMKDKDFPSYWTVVREKRDVIEHKDYLIERVRRY